jgi:hypothetical protein
VERSVETVTEITLDELDKDETEALEKRIFARGEAISPSVAQALVAGVPPREVAEACGISEATLRKYMRTFPLSDLLEVESRRVVHHLSSRDLGKVKYLALATSLGVMIEKTRLLREQPTSIPAGADSVERLANLLYGGIRGQGSLGVLQSGQVVEAESREVREGDDGAPVGDAPEENRASMVWDEL